MSVESQDRNIPESNTFSNGSEEKMQTEETLRVEGN